MMMITDPEVYEVETPNLTIRYRKSGAGKTPLIFLHGNFASSRWWLPQLDRLPADTTGYAPDLRGCGSDQGLTEVKRSEKGPLTISDLSRDLDEFISSLEIIKPIIIGHSLGGVVALDYAIRHQDRVHKLVLEDAGPPTNFTLMPFPGLFLFPLELGSKTIVKRAFQFSGLSSRGSFPKALISDALAGKPGQYLAFTQAVLNWNVSQKLHGLDLPVLLIWGQRDLIMPLRIAKQYQKRLANSKLSVIENSGHTPHLQKPDIFATELAKFIAENRNK